MGVTTGGRVGSLRVSVLSLFEVIGPIMSGNVTSMVVSLLPNVEVSSNSVVDGDSEEGAGSVEGTSSMVAEPSEVIGRSDVGATPVEGLGPALDVD